MSGQQPYTQRLRSLSASQVRRRLLFAFLLTLPILVVCNGDFPFIEINQDEAGCGDAILTDVSMVATAGSTTTTLDPNATGEQTLTAQEGAARVQAAVTTAVRTGATLAVQLLSPDQATPASVSGSYRIERLCPVTSEQFRQTVMNIDGPVNGFDGSTGAIATSEITADCGGGDTVTYNPAFGGVRLILPSDAASTTCVFDVTFSAQIENDFAFLLLGLNQTNIDPDGDGVGEPYDLDRDDASVSLPPHVAEVDHQTLGVHPWEIISNAGALPDLSGAPIEIRDVDALDVIRAEHAEGVIERSPVIDVVTESGGCLVAPDEADRCPVDLSVDLSNVVGRPSHGGSWFLVDDAENAPDLFAPNLVRTLSPDQVEDSRNDMLDPIIETNGSFEIVASTVSGILTREGVNSLAADLAAVTGEPTTGELLMRGGFALVELKTREGELDLLPLTLDVDPNSLDPFEIFHVPADGSSISPLAPGGTASTGGGQILIVNQHTDEDGSGEIEPDEAFTQLADFTVTSASDRWTGRVIVPAGFAGIVTENADLFCNGFSISGQRPDDLCVEGRIFELVGEGCADPLGADEACVELDLFPEPVKDYPVFFPDEALAIGCEQVDRPLQDGQICADLSEVTDAVPGSCAVIGGEGCPDNCALVGGICFGGGANQHCVAVGFGGCTDLSEANVCPVNQYCRPYTFALDGGGIEALPKYLCDTTRDCPKDTVCASDSFCRKAEFCDPAGPDIAAQCGGAEGEWACIPSSDDSGGRCAPVDSAPCFKDEVCGADGYCGRAAGLSDLTPNTGFCDPGTLIECDTGDECDSEICLIRDGAGSGAARGVCADRSTTECSPADNDCGAGALCEPLEIASWEKRACLTAVAP